MKKTPPCKECEQRHRLCHATCDEYKEWSVGRSKENAKKAKNKMDADVYDNYLFDKRKRNVK